MLVQPKNASAAASSLSSTPVVRSESKQQRLSEAAKEFEGVLLNQWLHEAESTFGAAPGGTDYDADDDQMKSFATQQLATQFAARGGIGIGRLVQQQLERSGSDPAAQPGAAKVFPQLHNERQQRSLPLGVSSKEPVA